MTKVFIVNKSSHDFSPATRFGEIKFLSEGPINRLATCHMIRLIEEGLAESNEHDYLVLCSLNVLNSLACAVFAHKHGRVNLLLFKDGDYIERNHVL